MQKSKYYYPSDVIISEINFKFPWLSGCEYVHPLLTHHLVILSCAISYGSNVVIPLSLNLFQIPLHPITCKDINIGSSWWKFLSPRIFTLWNKKGGYHKEKFACSHQLLMQLSVSASSCILRNQNTSLYAQDIISFVQALTENTKGIDSWGGRKFLNFF